jgi:hypothetical protein
MENTIQQTVYCFDVDGTLTPLSSTAVNPELAQRISDLLSADIPVGIITGRGAPWIARHVLPAIVPGKSPDARLPLFVSAEKGTVSATIADGTLVTAANHSYQLPLPLRVRIARLVAQSEDVFFDTDKEVVLSVEIRGGSPRDIVRQKRTLAGLVPAIESIVAEAGGVFVVLTEPVIALDIQHRDIDKADAADLFLEFLDLQKTAGSWRIYAFGDTKSDLRVAARMHERGRSVTFGYVGAPELPECPFPVVRPTDGRLYDAGVLELLAA